MKNEKELKALAKEARVVCKQLPKAEFPYLNSLRKALENYEYARRRNSGRQGQ